MLSTPVYLDRSPAASLPLYIEQATDWVVNLRMFAELNVLADLTGAVFALQIRQQAYSTTVLESLSTETSEITFDNTSSIVTIALPSSRTAVLNFGHGYYDLLYTPEGGDKKRILTGTISVSPTVTRNATVVQHVAALVGGDQSVTIDLPNYPLIPGTLSLFFNNVFMGTDDGAGNIQWNAALYRSPTDTYTFTDGSVYSGTVDYTTGVVTIVANSLPSSITRLMQVSAGY